MSGQVWGFARRAAPWGTLDVSPAARGAWQLMRLRVYPPGTSPRERRALGFAHSWPIAGSAGTLVVVAVLAALPPVADALPPVGDLAVVLLLYLAGFLLGARLTRRLRRRVRTLTGAVVYAGGEKREYGDVALLRASARRLAALEGLRREGLIGPVEYEAVWAEVYEAVGCAAATD